MHHPLLPVHGRALKPHVMCRALSPAWSERGRLHWQDGIPRDRSTLHPCQSLPPTTQPHTHKTLLNVCRKNYHYFQVLIDWLSYGRDECSRLLQTQCRSCHPTNEVRAPVVSHTQTHGKLRNTYQGNTDIASRYSNGSKRPHGCCLLQITSSIYPPQASQVIHNYAPKYPYPWGNLGPYLIHGWLGGWKGIWPVKNWVVGSWHGYQSGARCRLAYGLADATATHCLLLQWNPDWFYLSGTGSPG